MAAGWCGRLLPWTEREHGAGGPRHVQSALYVRMGQGCARQHQQRLKTAYRYSVDARPDECSVTYAAQGAELCLLTTTQASGEEKNTKTQRESVRLVPTLRRPALSSNLHAQPAQDVPQPPAPPPRHAHGTAATLPPYVKSYATHAHLQRPPHADCRLWPDQMLSLTAKVYMGPE